MASCAPLDFQIRDIDTAGFEAAKLQAFMCINCGEYLDKTIIENRKKWAAGEYEAVPKKYRRTRSTPIATNVIVAPADDNDLT